MYFKFYLRALYCATTFALSIIPVYAGGSSSSLEQPALEEELAAQHTFSSSRDSFNKDEFNNSGSLRLKKLDTLESSFKKRYRFSGTSRKLKQEDSRGELKEYHQLNADLRYQRQQLDWLEDLFKFGVSRGILFRDAESKEKAFFEDLKFLYKVEINFLPLFLLGKESEPFQKLSEELPAFMAASQRVFDCFKLIFVQAKDDLRIKQFYFDQFSEAFKAGQEKTTQVKPNEEEKGSATLRSYTTEHVGHVISQMYTQYHFFSKTLPLFHLIFETQIFMGQKLEPFFPKGKPKKSFQKKQFHSGEYQSIIRTSMDSLLEAYDTKIRNFNTILIAHNEHPVESDPALYEAQVLHQKAISLLHEVIHNHQEDSWAERLDSDISRIDGLLTNLLQTTTALISTPYSEELEWNEDFDLVRSSSSGKSPQNPRMQRKPSQLFDHFKRSLSKHKFSESSSSYEESSEPQPKETRGKKIKRKISQKLHHRLHKKDSV
jgi:hypothetical protein